MKCTAVRGIEAGRPNIVYRWRRHDALQMSYTSVMSYFMYLVQIALGGTVRFRLGRRRLCRSGTRRWWRRSSTTSLYPSHAIPRVARCPSVGRRWFLQTCCSWWRRASVRQTYVVRVPRRLAAVLHPVMHDACLRRPRCIRECSSTWHSSLSLTGR